MKIGYALLVDLYWKEQFIADGVYTFPTRKEAVGFAYQTLVNAREIKSGKKTIKDRLEAVEEWAESLDALQYYHIRDWRQPA